MNGHTEKAWPSYQTIADATGKSVKTIQRAIRELEDTEWLDVRRGNGTGPEALAGIDAAMKRIKAATLAEMPSARVIEYIHDGAILRLLVIAEGTQVKFEVSPVLRGVVGHVAAFPAIRWRQRNLDKLKPAQRSALVELLRTSLERHT